MILGGAIVFLLMQQCGENKPQQGTLISKENEIIHDTIKITEFKDVLIEKKVNVWQKQKDSLKTIFVDLPCNKKIVFTQRRSSQRCFNGKPKMIILLQT